MNITHPLINQVTQILDDIKATEIKIIDVKAMTSVTDYMIICTARSSRHGIATAQDLIEKMKHAGHKPLSQTGLDTGDWVLVDFGDVIVHIMLAETRAFYNIEALWEPNTEA